MKIMDFMKTGNFFLPRQMLNCTLACVLAFATVDASAAPLYAFTTSSVGTGDLHSWPEVNGTTLIGLDAADGICAARAQAAGLANPGEFMAWLSDANNDAYCRVSGFPGKKTNNCGQPALPVGAGPWLRTNGTPFAAAIERATRDDVIYAPLNIDESGNPAQGRSWTATSPLGEYDTSFGFSDCNAWTSASQSVAAILGNNSATAKNWTNADGGVSCDSSSQHLICLQIGSVPALKNYSRFGHREAFVTSSNVTGDLGGITGADGMCKALATSAHLHQPESFKALITSAALGTNVIDRFVFDGPWYRRDGLVFAHNKAELIALNETLPLNLAETGQYLGFALALTGANTGGNPNGLDCANWTSTTSGEGFSSVVNWVGPNWLSNAGTLCSGPQFPGDVAIKLMCLSDSDVLFHDEFEQLPSAL